MGTPFILTLDDLAKLPGLFPKLEFNRQEQVDALLMASSGDVQAAPGSGKTTLLGAKLSLMAARWPYARRGICILTHTNVARAEIERCLKSVPSGESLLAYPHYIGTIQSFVNRFVALPWLRTLGITPREVDEEDFSERFYSAAYKFSKGWIGINRYARESTIKQVRFRGPNLDLHSDADVPLPAGGQMVQNLRALKEKMAQDGRLRHADMFAYALQAMSQVPALAGVISHRFPNVFIDEMQDTSELQLEVLNAIFGKNSVVQRFGDVNQAILNRRRSSVANAFPNVGSQEVRISMRFGAQFAEVANSVKAVGQGIEGRGPNPSAPPTLFLYSDDTVNQVIARFGAWVANHAMQEELDALPVKAVCAIKSRGNPQQRVGRHIPDYFPGYDDIAANPTRNSSNAKKLMQVAGTETKGSVIEKRVSAARAALVLIVQAFGKSEYRKARHWRDLLNILGPHSDKQITLTTAAHKLVFEPYDMASEQSFLVALVNITRELGDIIDVCPSLADVPMAWLAHDTPQASEDLGPSNTYLVQGLQVSFPIHVATVASVKGETHLATLIMESCRNKKFDVQTLLPFLCGDEDARGATDEATTERLMNMFVGVTRPRKLLAVAMHVDRADIDCLKRLTRAGWKLLDMIEPRGETA
ncbi:UvrD-helicase domain-containing protein [Xanthomonas sacchari]|uniref:UvrD-helicase domain-containing protein n=1 Tax=Xanthomonas sacchari TaxID=56458 RepID=UPI0020C516EC|nr:UvrD-helicase domain-containing protein [Xanthomonas sacchari]